MTAPRLSIATDRGRMYARTPGGEPMHPSITNILEVLSADMEWWEALCAARLAIEHAPALADVHAMPRGRAKWDRERAAKDWLMGAAARDRDECAERGDFVHDYAEVFAKRTIGDATDADVDAARERAVAGGAGAYLPHFEAFWARWEPVVIVPEATVWNDTVGYAGTTDLLCQIAVAGRAVNVILDYKTKRALYTSRGVEKSDLKPLTAMQLAAAAFAEEMWVDGKGWGSLPFVPEIGLGVVIGPDGFAVRQYNIHAPIVWDAFKALRVGWDFKGADLMTSRLTGPDALILPDAIPTRPRTLVAV